MSNVFIHGGMHTPSDATLDIALEDGDRTYHLHLEGSPWHLNDRSIEKVNLFRGHNARNILNSDYLPVPLGKIGSLMDQRLIDLDTAVLNVSPPDKDGFYSLGCSADVAFDAAMNSRKLVLQVNKYVPYHRNCQLYLPVKNQEIKIIEHDVPLQTKAPAAPTEAQKAIAKHVASIIPQGATLQLGIGAIPTLVASHLAGTGRYEVYSEMVSDPVLDLETTSITTSFAVGTNRIVRATRDGRINYIPSRCSNSYSHLTKKRNLVSINSITEMDYTGASVCDSILGKHISGIGGQFDFVNAAWNAGNGMSILCLPSRTSTGDPRIVERLHSPATIPNYLVDYVATEVGVVQLKGMTIKGRRGLLTDLITRR